MIIITLIEYTKDFFFFRKCVQQWVKSHSCFFNFNYPQHDGRISYESYMKQYFNEAISLLFMTNRLNTKRNINQHCRSEALVKVTLPTQGRCVLTFHIRTIKSN